MTVKALRLLALTTAILGCINDAAAGERKHPIVLIGGIAMPVQAGPSGDSSASYKKAPGGASIGWVLGGGVRVARTMTVEAEFSRTDWIKARETSRYEMTFNEERRDRVVLFAARLHLGRADAIGVEPVVGLAVTTTEAWSQTESRNPLLPQQNPVIGPRQRVFMSGKSGYSEYPGGYPDLTVRFSLGARINLLSRWVGMTRD